jgi:replicative DNA helicase
MADVLPPHSAEAEEAVLGSLMVDPESIGRVRGMVAPSDFYIVKNGWVFEAICAAGENADVLTVADELNKQGQLEDAGGEAFLARLTDIPSALNVDGYAQIVREHSIRRRWIRTASEIAKLAYDRSVPVDAGQERMMAAAMGALMPGAGREAVAIREAIAKEFDWLQMVARGEVTPGEVSTGYADLDRLITGMYRGDLWVYGARPGMGKTALLSNLLARGAKRGQRCLFFSMEMNTKALATRYIASEGDVDHGKLRLAKLDEAEWGAIATLAGQDTPLWIDDSSQLGVAEMRARAAQVKAKHGLDVIGVDYLQICRTRTGNLEKRYFEIGEVARGLKQLAKDLGVVVIALAQVKRDVDNRMDKRPYISDLEESGQIEQAADGIGFLYRDEYYDGGTERKGVAEVLVRKNRNGPTGMVDLFWDKARQRYSELKVTKHEFGNAK